MVVDLCLALGNLTCYHKASLQSEPSKVPCRFMGQFLCMVLLLWPPSVFQGSLCLLSSARQLGSEWMPSLCAMVQKVLEAESTVNGGFTSFVSLFFQKVQSVLLGLFSRDWKPLLHRFCPVLSLFMEQGLVWNQFTSHTLLLMRLFLGGAFYVVKKEKNK